MKVLNRYIDDIPQNSIDISRKGPLGNPFRIGPVGVGHGSREEVIKLYEVNLRKTIARDADMKQRVKALKGFNLVCYCKPLPCHGDVLKKVCEELNGQKK